MIIGISGISGAGKTTLAKALATQLQATALFWDDFDPISKPPEDYVAWYEHGANYNEFDYQALADTIVALKSGVTVTHPTNQEI
ncbi:MAG TPA: hypothetical protein VHZ76_03140 [Gammaproteobacteria bacterium]|jgi:uridine kinase|nr:hypothetical protein [Gammaproteobacteria bacterium]